MFGTRWQCTTVFSEEDIEWNKGGKAYFLLIRHFYISEMGKTSSKSWAKWGSYYTAKTFSCNRGTAMWFALAPKMTSQRKKLYFDHSAITHLLNACKLDLEENCFDFCVELYALLYKQCLFQLSFSVN